jgi:hypothetical protein
MKTLPSPNRPISASTSVRSDVGPVLAALVIPWGSGFGMLVGAMIGAFAGGLVQDAMPGGLLEITLMGSVAGALAGLFLGFLIASVDVLLLARAVPAVLSGKTHQSTAAATASGAAVVAATGLVLPLVAPVLWRLPDEMWVLSPAVFLLAIPWVAVSAVGESALEGVLGSVS